MLTISTNRVEVQGVLHILSLKKYAGLGEVNYDIQSLAFSGNTYQVHWRPICDV